MKHLTCAVLFFALLSATRRAQAAGAASASPPVAPQPEPEGPIVLPDNLPPLAPPLMPVSPALSAPPRQTSLAAGEAGGVPSLDAKVSAQAVFIYVQQSKSVGGAV